MEGSGRRWGDNITGKLHVCVGECHHQNVKLGDKKSVLYSICSYCFTETLKAHGTGVSV